MEARKRYLWELTGFLIVRDVLTSEEVREANGAIAHTPDSCWSMVRTK